MPGPDQGLKCGRGHVALGHILEDNHRRALRHRLNRNPSYANPDLSPVQYPSLEALETHAISTPVPSDAVHAPCRNSFCVTRNSWELIATIFVGLAQGRSTEPPPLYSGTSLAPRQASGEIPECRR